MNRGLIICLFFLVLTPVLPVTSQKILISGKLTIKPTIVSSVSRTWDDLSLLYPEQFHNSSEIEQEIDQIASAVPELVNISVIGKSVQGKNIQLIKITNELNANPKAGVFFVAQHHAREEITVEATLRFILRLVNNYGVDPAITSYIDNEEIYIIPTLNPDGNDIVVDGGNEYLRKNLRAFDDDGDKSFDEDDIEDLDGDGDIYSIETYSIPYPGWNLLTSPYQDNLVEIIYEGDDDDGDGLVNEDMAGGIDLNRNYDYHWNDSSTDSGWGSDPTSEVYPGTAPFSEPETVALRDFVLEHKFAAAMSLHSGVNNTYFPYGYLGTWAEPTLYGQIWNELREIIPYRFFGNSHSSYNGNHQSNTRYKIASPGYTTAGSWDDWMYAIAGCKVPLTFEIYHNTSSMMKNVNYFLMEDDGSHQVWKWTGMYEYFAPDEGPAIDSLWQDVLPAFDYWLDITPRLDVTVQSVSQFGTNEGDLITFSLGIENLSPQLDTITSLEITDVSYDPLLLGSTAVSIAKIAPLEKESKKISFELPQALSGDTITVKVGNEYVGYHDIVIEKDQRRAPGFLVNSVLMVIPLLVTLKSWRKRFRELPLIRER
ncbi:MAG: M14 family zinc carboxypeptidase [Candidatus Odinarchaeota archaeon]